MVGGAISGSHYKVGTGFSFVAKPYTLQSGGWQMALYCGELNAWAGTSMSGGHPYYPTPPGGTVTIYDSSSYQTEGLSNAISSCNFCSLTTTVSGNGSVTDNATAYGSYRKQGDSITITATPASGYRLKKMLVNGSAVTTTAQNAYTTTVQDDMSVVAYFVPTAYTVTCETPSGGTVAFTKNGVAATAPFTAAVDDVIVCTATPNADKMVQNFVVDGYLTSGGSTGAQAFTFTIYEREDDATYNCAVTFADRTAVADSVVGKSDGTTDDAVVTCNGATVARTAGAFAAFVGNTYTATASAPTIFRSFGGWKNANGDVVSATYAYSWTQGNAAVSIVADYADKPIYAESFYVGTSTSDYGTGGTAYVAGCRADITRPSGESKVVGDVTKYLGGTRTVTATATPTGWTFNGVYVSDTDASGGTKFYKANGASSVTFDCDCNANIYAIFANGAEVTPSDVDQGDSAIATGAAATGLCEWEGGSSSLTMRYHSKRFVASMPMTLSTARVYADGYATAGANDVKLKVMAFQSPDTSDSRAVETTAKSQDAYRLPMRRPEKYIELEIAAPHQVTQVAVATGMEALWQA